MKSLIRRIINEETNSLDPKKILILKNFILDYFSKTDWFKDVDFEIGTFIGFKFKIPEIKITIYISDVDGEIDFSDFMDEIDFLMDMLFPRGKDGDLVVVWSMDIKEI